MSFSVVTKCRQEKCCHQPKSQTAVQFSSMKTCVVRGRVDGHRLIPESCICAATPTSLVFHHYQSDMLKYSLYSRLKTAHLGLQLSEVPHYVSAIRHQVIQVVLKAFQLLQEQTF